MAENKMEFRVTGSTENMTTQVETQGGHHVTIDEPPSMGGADKGPDPLGNLLASLAGCETVVANMVAKETQFDLQSIHFDIHGELDPRGLMGQADVRPYFQTVTVHADVKTSEDESRIQELQEKTDARCPVFTTLKAAGVDMKVHWNKA
ncbi:OsmC family protein [Alkalicoccus chagannorensis]|uniref:OsmC family protein n=1 Tax=Alkalicoccus chagannorensis TaxID=427072 RepID=UPI00047900D2|nr:OsmC family protein [Alkalicoccus chagannorensis]